MRFSWYYEGRIVSSEAMLISIGTLSLHKYPLEKTFFVWVLVHQTSLLLSLEEISQVFLFLSNRSCEQRTFALL